MSHTRAATIAHCIQHGILANLSSDRGWWDRRGGRIARRLSDVATKGIWTWAEVMPGTLRRTAGVLWSPLRYRRNSGAQTTIVLCNSLSNSSSLSEAFNLVTSSDILAYLEGRHSEAFYERVPRISLLAVSRYLPTR